MAERSFEFIYFAERKEAFRMESRGELKPRSRPYLNLQMQVNDL